MKKLLSILATSLALNGYAEEYKSVFSCETKDNKNIEVLRNADMAMYRYGRGNRPAELELKRKLSEAEISFGIISGNEISNSVVFNNGKYQYQIISSVDRNAETQEPKHGVLITRNSTYLGYKACVPGTVKGSLLDLSE